MSAADGVQQPPVLFTPEQMQQIRAIFQEMPKQSVNPMRDRKAETQLDLQPPADPQGPLANKPRSSSNPLTSPLDTRSSQSAAPSSGATQGSSCGSKGSRESRTRYMFGRNGKGEKSIRRYRERTPPYDPKMDPQMTCHTAAHKVCSAIVRAFGFSGEW
jgi:hypothetical protein